jgi:hypothetical protein
VPDAGASVDGRILDEIDDAAVAALDRYEDAGRLYHRRRVVVHVDGDAVDCDAYAGIRRRRARAPARRRRRASRA